MKNYKGRKAFKAYEKIEIISEIFEGYFDHEELEMVYIIPDCIDEDIYAIRIFINSQNFNKSGEFIFNLFRTEILNYINQ